MVTALLGGHRLTPTFGLILRLTYTFNWPDVGPSGTAFANPALVALWAPQLDLPVKLAFSGVFVAPLGQGGGLTPDPATSASIKAAGNVRSAMDGSVFSPNYLTLVAGAAASWNRHGVTVHAEANILNLFHVKDSVEEDVKISLTSGLHVGWAFWGPLNAAAEFHYQRWLTTPDAVTADDTKREQGSFLLGLRATFKAGGVTLRPGISYAQGFDAPMSALHTHNFQLDVPVVF